MMVRYLALPSMRICYLDEVGLMILDPYKWSPSTAGKLRLFVHTHMDEFVAITKQHRTLDRLFGHSEIDDYPTDGIYLPDHVTDDEIANIKARLLCI